jgi:hypothetical protein
VEHYATKYANGEAVPPVLRHREGPTDLKLNIPVVYRKEKMSEDTRDENEMMKTEPKKVYCCPGYERQRTTSCPSPNWYPQMPPHLEAPMKELDEQIRQIDELREAALERKHKRTGNYWLDELMHFALELEAPFEHPDYDRLCKERRDIMEEFYNTAEYKQYEEEEETLRMEHFNQCTCGKEEYHYEGEGICRDCGREVDCTHCRHCCYCDGVDYDDDY